MKTRNIILMLIIITVISSCKKEECEECETLPIVQAKSVVGKWKLVEYTKEEYYRWKSTSSNSVNNNVSISDENNSDIEIFNNGILKEERIDSTNTYSNNISYNEMANIFNDTSYTDIFIETKKFTFLYSCEIEISKDTWVSKTYSSMNYWFSSELSLKSGDTASYMFWGGDSLITPNDSIIENGNLYWSDNIINAGPMSGKIKSISDTEIIIEEIIIENDKKYSNSFRDSIYTYNNINNPYLKEEGVIGILYEQEDITKIYYKWISNE